MNEKNNPGILIAAIKSGSGKTTFTCALLEALKERKLCPAAFKCGPDYIDPMFHQKVIGVPSENLDPFFSTKDQLKDIYDHASKEGRISVVEGVMGLYDGLGGVSEEGSAYHLAKILNLPIILVIDAHGMGRSIIPLIAGFLQYDPLHLIKGVVLNKVSPSFYETIKEVIQKELKIEVFGYIPKKKELNLESRHLGLKLPGEIKDLQDQIHLASEIIEETVKIDRILEIAGRKKEQQFKEKQEEVLKKKVRIAVAKDDAFCFYYGENLRMLEKYGAQLVYFSPLKDEKLPDHVDGILLGGGYPEIYAEQLEKNESMRNSIKEAVENGMPSLAECGGFLYLHDHLEDENKKTYEMCHVLKGKCSYKGKLVRFGYIDLMEKEEEWMGKRPLKAHEFHYFDSECNGDGCTAVKPVSGKSWECIKKDKRNFWGFAHLYYASNPEFVIHFIREALEYQKEK